MAYTKQNFTDGQTLTHTHLNNIEDGIVAIENSVIDIEKGGTGATTAANARTNLGVTPDNIGAVKKSGDTMTGTLVVPYFRVNRHNIWTGMQILYDDVLTGTIQQDTGTNQMQFCENPVGATNNYVEVL